MTRSKRHTPARGIGGGSDKRDKRIAQRRLRRRVKVAVEQGAEVVPELREVSDVWDFRKDGKIYLGEWMRPKDLRK